MVDVSVSARNFFSTLGVNLFPPKSVFFNDRLGLLFVRATMQDLDTIESAIQALNQVAPQVHVKARFIQVQQNDNAGLGFDWYLGQFNIGNSVSAQGGTAPSLYCSGAAGRFTVLCLFRVPQRPMRFYLRQPINKLPAV